MKLPDDHPCRIDMKDWWFVDDPSEAVDEFVQKDSTGCWRVVTHNGLGEVLDLSPPIRSRIDVERRYGRGDPRWWADARARRVTDYWVRRRKYDGVDWWE